MALVIIVSSSSSRSISIICRRRRNFIGINGNVLLYNSAFSLSSLSSSISFNRGLLKKRRPKLRSTTTTVAAAAASGYNEENKLIKSPLSHETEEIPVGETCASDYDCCLDLIALSKWHPALQNVCTEEEEDNDKLEMETNPFNGRFCSFSDDDWKRLSPSIIDDITTTTTTMLNKPPQTMLPRMDDLLFVYKPSGLLTLPGIGPHKADCLASRVNSWLITNPLSQTSSSSSSSRLQPLLYQQTPQSNKVTNNNENNNNNNNDDNNNKTKKWKSKKKKKSKHSFVPRPVHRLDMDTSGVVLFALNSNAHKFSSILFQEHLVSKTYIALVAGWIQNDSGIIDLPIGKISSQEREGGGGHNQFACPPLHHDNNSKDHLPWIKGSLRDAKTQWSVSKRFRFTLPSSSTSSSQTVTITRVILHPLTGRGHQLRLHMAAIGHPILGDTLHSPLDSIAKVTPRLCLHAQTLEIFAKRQQQQQQKSNKNKGIEENVSNNNNDDNNDNDEVVLLSVTSPAPF